MGTGGDVGIGAGVGAGVALAADGAVVTGDGNSAGDGVFGITLCAVGAGADVGAGRAVEAGSGCAGAGVSDPQAYNAAEARRTTVPIVIFILEVVISSPRDSRRCVSTVILPPSFLQGRNKGN